MVNLAFLNLGAGEIGLVLVLLLLLFGIDKAPKLARALGRVRGELERAKGTVETALKTEDEKAFDEQLAFEAERERKMAEAAAGEKSTAEAAPEGGGATISPRQDDPGER